MGGNNKRSEKDVSVSMCVGVCERIVEKFPIGTCLMDCVAT